MLGCLHAVNASGIAVVVNGQNFSVPVDGFGASSNSSSAGRRLMAALSSSRSESVLRHKPGPMHKQATHMPGGGQASINAAQLNQRRSLKQANADVFSIQLTISKCSDNLPVVGATVRVPRCLKAFHVFSL